MPFIQYEGNEQLEALAGFAGGYAKESIRQQETADKKQLLERQLQIQEDQNSRAAELHEMKLRLEQAWEETQAHVAGGVNPKVAGMTATELDFHKRLAGDRKKQEWLEDAVAERRVAEETQENTIRAFHAIQQNVESEDNPYGFSEAEVEEWRSNLGLGEDGLPDETLDPRRDHGQAIAAVKERAEMAAERESADMEFAEFRSRIDGAMVGAQRPPGIMGSRWNETFKDAAKVYARAKYHFRADWEDFDAEAWEEEIMVNLHGHKGVVDRAHAAGIEKGRAEEQARRGQTPKEPEPKVEAKKNGKPAAAPKAEALEKAEEPLAKLAELSGEEKFRAAIEAGYALNDPDEATQKAERERLKKDIAAWRKRKAGSDEMEKTLQTEKRFGPGGDLDLGSGGLP